MTEVSKSYRNEKGQFVKGNPGRKSDLAMQARDARKVLMNVAEKEGISFRSALKRLYKEATEGKELNLEKIRLYMDNYRWVHDKAFGKAASQVQLDVNTQGEADSIKILPIEVVKNIEVEEVKADESTV
ncbi:MAG: hypothetical protein AAF655_12530 [Bacteroidota bacterium]